MNKRLISLLTFLVLVSLSFLSCSDAFDENEFTIENRSGGTIKINFRAEEVTIGNGQVLVLKEIPKGRYDYITVFEAPENAEVQTEGPVSGEISFNAGTKALLIFVASYDGSTYTIFASLTIDESLDGSGLTDPLGN